MQSEKKNAVGKKNAVENALKIDLFETKIDIIATKESREQCDKLISIFEGFFNDESAVLQKENSAFLHYFPALSKIFQNSQSMINQNLQQPHQ